MMLHLEISTPECASYSSLWRLSVYVVHVPLLYRGVYLSRGNTIFARPLGQNKFHLC
jgi:hypothetical protein